jgi:hypothetical protein
MGLHVRPLGVLAALIAAALLWLAINVHTGAGVAGLIALAVLYGYEFIATFGGLRRRNR